MKFLVRQTYTAASLVAMVPAAIWSVSWGDGGGMTHIIGRFPYVYLFICQVMVVPRYVAAAWLTVWFKNRYKQFDTTGGFAGFTVVGLVLDSWLTFHFASAISQPQYNGAHPLLIPFWALFYGAVLMVLGSLAGGFGWPYIMKGANPSPAAKGTSRIKRPR